MHKLHITLASFKYKNWFNKKYIFFISICNGHFVVHKKKLDLCVEVRNSFLKAMPFWNSVSYSLHLEQFFAKVNGLRSFLKKGDFFFSVTIS